MPVIEETDQADAHIDDGEEEEHLRLSEDVAFK